MSQVIIVDEYTTPAPKTVQMDTRLSEVLDLMQNHNIRHIPVLSDSELVGILSDRDVKVAAQVSDLENLTAEQVMTPEPYSVDANTPLEQVVITMSDKKIGSAVVVNAEGQLTGIFTSTDALNALVEVLRGGRNS